MPRPQLWLSRPRSRRRHPALEELARGERRYRVGRVPQPRPRRPRLRLGGARLWLRLVAAALALGLSASAVLGVHALLSGDALRVREIDVAGTGVADPYAVARAADLGGRSLLAMDADDAAARVAALPEVKSASVRRVWPRGVAIEVVEHRGWGYWEAAGRRVVIDADGLVLERGRPPAPDAVTIVEREGAQPPQAGDVMDADTLRAVGRLIADARSQRLDIVVRRFEFHRDRGLIVRVEDGPDAVFGDSHNYDFKVAAWGALLDRLEREGSEAREVREIDMRFGRHLVMR